MDKASSIEKKKLNFYDQVFQRGDSEEEEQP